MTSQSRSNGRLDIATAGQGWHQGAGRIRCGLLGVSGLVWSRHGVDGVVVYGELYAQPASSEGSILVSLAIGLPFRIWAVLILDIIRCGGEVLSFSGYRGCRRSKVRAIVAKE